jgi:hypothetical protein
MSQSECGRLALGAEDLSAGWIWRHESVLFTLLGRQSVMSRSY